MKTFKYEEIGWAFDCPIHGYENQVFCYRAYNEKYKDNWRITRTSYNKPSSEQLEKFLSEFSNIDCDQLWR